MNAPARVGLVGCGVISHAYAKNAAAFDGFEFVTCADRDEERSAALAAEHGLDAVDVDALLSDTELDVVLNLTPPAAHAGVTRAALEAGKHVYSEKPLAMMVAEAAELLTLADARGLRVACAPDIFLGGDTSGGARADRPRGHRQAPGRFGHHAGRRPGGMAPGSGHLLPRRRGPAARHGPVLPLRARRAARAGRACGRARLDHRHRADDRDRTAPR